MHYPSVMQEMRVQIAFDDVVSTIRQFLLRQRIGTGVMRWLVGALVEGSLRTSSRPGLDHDFIPGTFRVNAHTDRRAEEEVEIRRRSSGCSQ